jgi:DNA-binding IclR family transcriptional regulator
MTNTEVKSAARVLDIFSILVKYPDGLSLSELCDILKYPKSSTHGLLATMVQRGYLRPGRRERTYRLGPALFELGSAYIASTSLVSDGWEIVRSTARICDETVHLAVLDGTEVLYVAKEEGTNTIRMVSAVGKRFPAYATGVGKILLANLSDSELLQLFPDHSNIQKITPNTITSATQLRHIIQQARHDQFAIDLQESTPGLCCVAAPVYDANGQICAGLSISVPSIRFTDSRRSELIELVKRQSHQLSVILGYTARYID